MKKSDMQPSPDGGNTASEKESSWDLELPYEPDFVSQRTQYPLDKALDFVEEVRAMFPPRPDEAERRRENKCLVEFVL
jgi:hypothetical protein